MGRLHCDFFPNPVDLAANSIHISSRVLGNAIIAQIQSSVPAVFTYSEVGSAIQFRSCHTVQWSHHTVQWSLASTQADSSRISLNWNDLQKSLYILTTQKKFWPNLHSDFSNQTLRWIYSSQGHYFSKQQDAFERHIPESDFDLVFAFIVFAQLINEIIYLCIFLFQGQSDMQGNVI